MLHISLLVDDRNKSLYDEVSEKYSITLAPSINEEYGCYSINQSAVIYIPSIICIDSFTHELLHLWVKVKGAYPGSSLIRQVKSDTKLSRLLSDELLNHIGNCLDHAKMLPFYVEMGFASSKFIMDYDVIKCNEQEINRIKAEFRVGAHHWGAAVDYYIGKFIAMVFDPNKQINYLKFLNELENIDSGLYSVVEMFTTEWSQFDIESTDFMYTYDDVVYKFISGLKLWSTDKSFL